MKSKHKNKFNIYLDLDLGLGFSSSPFKLSLKEVDKADMPFVIEPIAPKSPAVSAGRIKAFWDSPILLATFF